MKTAELVGPALDWAVAEADGLRPYPHKGGFWVLDGKTNAPLPKFSTDWAHGGPLIELFIGAVSGPTPAREYSIACIKGDTNPVRGGSMLIAACRAIVSAKLGDVVQVPAELLGVAA